MLDPICLMHGKPKSTHFCVQCCLCYKDLTLEECHLIEDDEFEREDLCNACAEKEAERISNGQYDGVVLPTRSVKMESICDNCGNEMPEEEATECVLDCGAVLCNGCYPPEFHGCENQEDEEDCDV